MDTELIFAWGVQVLTRLPILAVLTVGLALAALRWHKQPLVARLAASGLGLKVVLTLASTSFAMLPLLLSRDGRSAEDIGSLMGWGSAAITLVDLGAWVLILGAIFYGRADSPAGSPAG